MPEKSTYLALTIGPIIKTLEQAKTTRELWVASYFFSKLAKLFSEYEPLKKYLLSPQPVNGCTFGAGVYPDRVYWKIDNLLTKEDVEKMQNEILTKLFAEIDSPINPFSNEQLKKYVKTYFLQVSFTEEELREKSFLFRLNELLDGLELQNKWEQNPSFNILTALIGKGLFEDPNQRPVYKWRNEFLKNPQCMNDKGEVNSHYIKYGILERLPTLIEITTRPLQRCHNDWFNKEITQNISENLENEKTHENEDEDDLMKKIKEKYDDMFRVHHKYVCIVQSDGDGIRKYLENQVKNDKDEFIKFSKQLNDFVVNATKMIEEFGGVPVYAGGDDLLFFAPVMHQNNNGENIIHLTKKLNNELQKNFPKPNTLTLSFGVSMTYYKYPMEEALASAYNLLFNISKKQPSKNYVSVKAQKHSGQSFNFGFSQIIMADKSSLYDCFLELIVAGSDKDENFLNSLMYKLDNQKMVINHIANDERKLKLFFDENFNEAVHEDYLDFFTQAGKLINKTFDTFKTEKLAEKMDRIYSTLRFIHFLNAKDTHE